MAMFCRKCGAQNDDNSFRCLQCGEYLHQAGGGANMPMQQIPNYLVQAILVTILCCVPLGIPAIVFSAQVNSKVQAGDIPGALESSRKAKMWCWWAFGLGLIAVALNVVFVIISMLAQISAH